MSFENSDGPRATRRPTANTIPAAAQTPVNSEDRTTAVPSANALPEMVAGVTILLGGPSAVQDRAMLRNCPLTCGAVHVFYVPAGTWRNRQPIIRAPRCAPRRRLRLEVVDVLPAVSALAGQRRRWTA